MTDPIAGGHRKFSEIRREVTPSRRSQIDAIKKRMEAAERLFEIRRDLGITQADVAEAMGISQGNVSTLEHREDALLSTVRAYVDALGGVLELKVLVGDRSFDLDLRALATIDDDTASALNVGPLEETERAPSVGAVTA
jgi:transcriptional regulator with XRE-family HTH domain